MRILSGSISVLLMFLASVAIAQTGPLGERTVLDGRLDILIPDDFEEMAPDLLRFKYPSENRPTLVFTNPDGSINVGFNHTNTSANPEQLPEFHHALDTFLRGVHKRATWHESTMREINGRQFLFFDFISQAFDTRIRNMILGTTLDNRLLLITFNVTSELEEQWAETGKRIVASISISD